MFLKHVHFWETFFLINKSIKKRILKGHHLDLKKKRKKEKVTKYFIASTKLDGFIIILLEKNNIYYLVYKKQIALFNNGKQSIKKTPKNCIGVTVNPFLDHEKQSAS